MDSGAKRPGNSLRRLEEDVRQSFDYLCLNTDPWVPHSADIDDVVTIVGAGQNGIATAYALRRKGIVARVIEAEKEGAEGVWLKRARMRSLRTPKDRSGPELSIPALTFKAWYVAKFGIDADLAMGLPPRETWADYLVWFRKVLQIDVEFETRLISVEPFGRNLKLVVSANDAHRTITTRKVILATGLSAGGTVNVPTVIADNLPRHRYAHTNDVIDFEALKGKRIGILGASASGFDAAATALENGAASARLFCRSSDLARGTRSRLVDFPRSRLFPFAS